MAPVAFLTYGFNEAKSALAVFYGHSDRDSVVAKQLHKAAGPRTLCFNRNDLEPFAFLEFVET
jgi:hypothetical protein